MEKSSSVLCRALYTKDDCAESIPTYGKRSTGCKYISNSGLDMACYVTFVFAIRQSRFEKHGGESGIADTMTVEQVARIHVRHQITRDNNKITLQCSFSFALIFLSSISMFASPQFCLLRIAVHLPCQSLRPRLSPCNARCPGKRVRYKPTTFVQLCPSTVLTREHLSLCIR